MAEILWVTKKGLVSDECAIFIHELIKDLWKITGIQNRGYNIGIDKYIKRKSDNKLNKLYLKG